MRKFKKQRVKEPKVDDGCDDVPGLGGVYAKERGRENIGSTG